MRYATFIVLLSCLMGCSDNKEYHRNSTSTSYSSSYSEPLENAVYVCNGKSAKRYHSDKYCKGLRRCRSGISEVSLEEAMEYRTPCKICSRGKN